MRFIAPKASDVVRATDSLRFAAVDGTLLRWQAESLTHKVAPTPDGYNIHLRVCQLPVDPSDDPDEEPALGWSISVAPPGADLEAYHPVLYVETHEEAATRAALYHRFWAKRWGIFAPGSTPLGN